MGGDGQQIVRFVGRARRRAGRVLALRGAARGLFCGLLGLSLLWALGRPALEARAWVMAAGGLFLAAAIGALAGAAWTPSRGRTARILDRRLALAQRVETALEVLEDGDGVARLLRGDAARRLRGVALGPLFPWRVGLSGRAALGGLAALLVAGMVGQWAPSAGGGRSGGDVVSWRPVAGESGAASESDQAGEFGGPAPTLRGEERADLGAAADPQVAGADGGRSLPEGPREGPAGAPLSEAGPQDGPAGSSAGDPPPPSATPGVDPLATDRSAAAKLAGAAGEGRAAAGEGDPMARAGPPSAAGEEGRVTQAIAGGEPVESPTPGDGRFLLAVWQSDFEAYWRLAEEALAGDRIPPGLEMQVRDYFLAIRPTE